MNNPFVTLRDAMPADLWPPTYQALLVVFDPHRGGDSRCFHLLRLANARIRYQHVDADFLYEDEPDYGPEDEHWRIEQLRSEP